MSTDTISFQMLTKQIKNIVQLWFTDTPTWKSTLPITDTEMAMDADTDHGLRLNGKAA